MKSVQEKILYLIDSYPLFIGGLFLILGLVYLIYKIDKRESYRMKDYDVMNWKAMVNSYTLIFMLIIAGLFIIFRL